MSMSTSTMISTPDVGAAGEINEKETGQGHGRGQDLSREEVRAQREVAKAAKAARKKKKGGEATPGDDDVPAKTATPKSNTPGDKTAQTVTPKLENGPSSPKNLDKTATPKNNTPRDKTVQTLTLKLENGSPKNLDKTATPKSNTPREKKVTILIPKVENGSNSPRNLEKTCTTTGTPVKLKSSSSKSPRRVTKSKSPSTFVPPPSEPSPAQIIPHIEPPQPQDDGPPTFESIEEKMHPIFRELGLKYANRKHRGSNSRTRALIRTTQTYIKNCHLTPEGKSFKQDLSAQLHLQFDGLKLYRPYAIGMKTAIEGIYHAIRSLPEDDRLTDLEYREKLESWMDNFIEEKITKAVDAITQKGSEKITDGETILIYSLTEALHKTIKLAGEQGRRFKIILALARPRSDAHHYLEEYSQLRKSLGEEVTKSGRVGITCINLSSIMSFIAGVDKVFLGGHAIFTTGGVMAHAGACSVALCAGSCNIPVIFFCETYKFCDKSPTDAFHSDVFTENKFGFSSDKENKDKNGAKGGKKTQDGPAMPKICFDVTPVSMVSCVITDIDMLPSSSVPVVLRVQENRPFFSCL